MAETFYNAVLNWTNKAKGNMSIVMKEAAQELFFDILKPVGSGGRMPVDTGFLRASASVTLDTPDLRTTTNTNDQAQHTFDAGPINLTINNMKLGQTIYMTMGANYATFVEYGTRYMAPRAFVRANVANWQSYVNEAARKVASR